MGNGPELLIADPLVVQEMMVTKNEQIDKTGKFGEVFKNFFGSAFVFAKTDALWKSKRKAMAHAFYKDRLRHILEALKRQVEASQSRWLAEIRKNGAITIDLAEEILPIFQKLMMRVTLGADLDTFSSIEIMKKVEGPTGISYVPSHMNLSEAVEETFQQTFPTFSTRFPNPLWNLIVSWTGVNLAFTADERQADANCRVLRDNLREYVRKRASGAEKSTLEGDTDLLSLMMQSPEVFDEDAIIDELLDFLTAGTQTSLLITQVILSHFATDPESLARIRAEYASTFPDARDYRDLTLESVHDLPYLNQVV